MRAHVMAGFVVLAVASTVLASDVAGVTSFGGGKQIWINSGAYDAREDHYVADTNATGMLSGSAYYVPTIDSGGTKQPWWMEYSISAADVPGVDLSGTWYFWGRIMQPTGSQNLQQDLPNDSHLLFVKNDDAAGADWYATALAGNTNADDRVFNDLWHIDGNQSYVPGTWRWFSTQDGLNPMQLQQKNFVLENGEIVFRISEREGYPYNARFDVLVWSNVAGYVPSDADYVPEPATMSLLGLGALALLRRRRAA